MKVCLVGSSGGHLTHLYIYIVACGSAWHVGMAAQYVLEDIVDIPVRVELASEFRYRKMPLNQKALVRLTCSVICK